MVRYSPGDVHNMSSLADLSRSRRPPSLPPAAKPYLRVALGAAGVFALVALCSALGWLLPWDRAVLAAIVSDRSCVAVAVSSLVTPLVAIETVAIATVLLVGGLAVTGHGVRAGWAAAWLIGLPVELALKMSVRHPMPYSQVPAQPLACGGGSVLDNPALSPFANPAVVRWLNPTGPVVQPLLETVFGHSFPSGYAVRATFFMALATMLLWSRLAPRLRPTVLVIAAILTVLLVGTRLVLVWHWPSDVLGGLVLGTLLACVARGGWMITPVDWPGLRRAITASSRRST